MLSEVEWVIYSCILVGMLLITREHDIHIVWARLLLQNEFEFLNSLSQVLAYVIVL